MFDPVALLGRARDGSVPRDWQVFVGARRPYIAEMVTALLGTACMLGAAAVVGGPGDSVAAAGVFAFFALLGLMGMVGAYIGLRHVDQFLLVLTPEGMVERHFWATGRDIH